MSHLLDTNVCIKLLNNSNQKIVKRLASYSPDLIYISTVTIFELYYGAYRSQRKEQNLINLQRFINEFKCLNFTEKAGEKAGYIRSYLAAKGTPIGVYDLQIAAIAVVNNLILVTHNVNEFNRVNDLVIEDWEE
ncbi:type II toxin-antitoxin system VapC family toxin [Gloeocapsa sp. PCC 73106]|uniref:type II toxin-antitoxin system tRNA(fMet)-specific endonuclease VapC n=1 Tax=Gloeocapsa sp. PCC 73106 TaxID=102232 RepID=UPI0002AC30A2|nr:type II toxin-antitoxin system VapC family toxin [Gloeocapsa sp. PCC 73106]ELR96868.1 putative nucleic acid-binding protein [Gloeocapsa sp. PCC 73106]